MPETAIDAGQFEACLRHRLPGVTGATVTELAKFPRGVSRETWAVKALVSDGSGTSAREYSIRCDLPGGAIQPYPLRLEFDVYWKLRDTQVPVARPLWYEDDPAWLLDGREFYVRERAEGHWDVPGVRDPDPRFDALRVQCAKEHLRNLALVHTLDWRALGFDQLFEPPPSAREAGVFRTNQLERLLRSYLVEPLPVVTECLGWLRENAPTDAPCVTLCKGTNGLGEEVWRDGVIVAMSDWEEACITDPANDFAHIQDLLPPPDGTRFGGWTLEDALAYYTSVSGIPMTVERVQFYRVMRSLEVVLFSSHAVLPLVRGTDLMARLAWVSTEMLYMGQAGLARAAGLFDER